MGGGGGGAITSVFYYVLINIHQSKKLWAIFYVLGQFEVVKYYVPSDETCAAWPNTYILEWLIRVIYL